MIIDWNDLRKTITGKLRGEIVPRERHDYGLIDCGDGVKIMGIKLGHHRGDMKPWEIAGCATKMRISQGELKKLTACTMSREDLCAKFRTGVSGA